MAESKYELARMTYVEAREAFSHNPVILIPMGSTEQHGPQCPVGDYRIADALAKELATRTQSICSPVIPYSEGAAAKGFPGAVPIQPETLYQLVRDVCEAFIRFELDHLLLVCGDHGNIPILERLARDVKDELSVRIGMIEQFRWFTPELLKRVYGEDLTQIAHGGDPITSINLHLFPDDVRRDLIAPPERRQFQGLDVKGFSQVGFGEHTFFLPTDYREISPSGVLGDASIASPERGKLIWEQFIRNGVEIIERFKQVETTL